MSDTATIHLPVASQVFSFVIPLICLIVLSVSEYRRTGKKYRVATPIDFLKDDYLVLPYAAAFGVVSSSVIYLLIDGRNSNFINVSSDVKPWIQLPLWLLLSTLIAFQYYPIFAAIRHQAPFVGPVVGFVCSSFQYYLTIHITVVQIANGKADSSVDNTAFLVVFQLPELVCLAFLLLYFVYRFTCDLRSTFSASNADTSKVNELIRTNGFERKYVKWILHKQTHSSNNALSLPSVQDCAKKAKQVLQLGALTNVSLRIVSTFVVCGIILFKLAIWDVYVWSKVDLVKSMYDINFLSENSSSSLNAYVSQITTFQHVLNVSVNLSVTIATITMIVYMVLIYRTYKQDLERMYKGDFSFLPTKIRNRKHNDIVFQSIKYSGFQIAYMFWCYILVSLSCTLLCFALAYGLILPLLDKVPDVFLVPVKTFAPLFIARFLFNLIELKFITARFVQKKETEHLVDKEDKTLLALKNRNSFNIIAYFLFFYHAIVGFIGCISRVLIGGLVGAFTVARLDGCRLPRGYENFDTGYSTYVGLIMLELYHRNPILLVFCDELLQNTQNGGIDLSDVYLQIPNERLNYQSNVSKTMNQKSSRRIRNRWRKAVTLLKNESLRKNSKASESKSEPETVYESIFW